ncbi:hypothetical protein [Cloacibacterium sp.]|uniref:hypothetical protein n=1 Tax=Cloacibacterium sp. TaxID=1913682 RepID=UPI0039E697CD
MKLFKKILLAFPVLILLSIVLGYFYFDRKFSPEKNHLQVKNESGKIPMKWETNTKDAMLLPVHFDADTTTYYVQFDTGSPSTIFYKNSITGIRQISVQNNLAKGSFKIGNCEVKSNQFKIIDFGKKLEKNKLNIIGTIGTDLLEDRKALIDFKNNYVIFNLNSEPNYLKKETFDFKFKKRKIIIPGVLDGKDEKFLYDSGASAFELLTTKEIWEKSKLKNSKIKIEKEKSWDNILTTYTAETDKNIEFQHTKIPLHEITYVDGYSKSQYYLMKYSGMSGMLGNKIFLQKQVYIDAKNLKMAIH